MLLGFSVVASILLVYGVPYSFGIPGKTFPSVGGG